MPNCVTFLLISHSSNIHRTKQDRTLIASSPTHTCGKDPRFLPCLCSDRCMIARHRASFEISGKIPGFRLWSQGDSCRISFCLHFITRERLQCRPDDLFGTPDDKEGMEREHRNCFIILWVGSILLLEKAGTSVRSHPQKPQKHASRICKAVFFFLIDYNVASH